MAGSSCLKTTLVSAIGAGCGAATLTGAGVGSTKIGGVAICPIGRRAGVVEKIRHEVPLGGLVFEVDEFFGDNAGLFEAVDARNGKPLWHFNAGQEFSASPMTYAVAGKQYVAIAAGSDVFSFGLP